MVPQTLPGSIRSVPPAGSSLVNRLLLAREQPFEHGGQVAVAGYGDPWPRHHRPARVGQRGQFAGRTGAAPPRVSRRSRWMRAPSQASRARRRSGQAVLVFEEPIPVCIGGAGRRLGADPRRQRSTGHAVVQLLLAPEIVVDERSRGAGPRGDLVHGHLTAAREPSSSSAALMSSSPRSATDPRARRQSRQKGGGAQPFWCAEHFRGAVRGPRPCRRCARALRSAPPVGPAVRHRPAVAPQPFVPDDIGRACATVSDFP